MPIEDYFVRAVLAVIVLAAVRWFLRAKGRARLWALWWWAVVMLILLAVVQW